MRYLEPLAYVALLLAALLACGGGEAPKAKPTGPTPKEICAKLTAASVARNCTGGDEEGPLGFGCKCDASRIAGYDVHVMAYNAQEYPKFAADAEAANKKAAGHDDYPDLQIVHAPTRTLIWWDAKPGAMGKGSLDTPEGDRWEACIKARKPVATCAKAQPAYYAANKALHEAAKRAVGAK